MAHVSVDRIQLRVRGLSPAAARLLVEGLDQQILEQLGEHEASWRGKGVVRVDRLDLPPMHFAVVGTGEIRAQVAEAIAGAIAGAMPDQSGERE